MSNPDKNFNIEEGNSVMDSIRLSRILIPAIIGIGIVTYMMYNQLDMEEFARINWNGHLLFWLFMAVMMYVLRHLFYAARLRLMSDEVFGWKKSIQLIFIWEFASAVSPTSVGGSGVALFLLAQEKLSAGKTVSVVLYSMVLDTVFFIIALPLLYLALGATIIRPGMTSITDLDGFGYTFMTVLVIMTLYGLVFFYGLFMNPRSIYRILLFFSRRKMLSRFKDSLMKTAEDVIVTSKQLVQKPMSYHIKAMIHTTGAWVTRFVAISFIIVALVPDTGLDIFNQLTLLGRGASMHVVTAFTPTPGGSGVAEYLFGGFYSDYISEGISSLAALIWRLITYYPYLIAGVIIVPIWFSDIVKRKRTGEL